jgi:hypothetical protein
MRAGGRWKSEGKYAVWWDDAKHFWISSGIDAPLVPGYKYRVVCIVALGSTSSLPNRLTD